MLQSKLRLFARTYLQENLSSLQALPSAEEFERLKAEKRRELQLKIEREKRASMAIRNRELDASPRKVANVSPIRMPPSKVQDSSIQDRGWAPKESSRTPREDDDPILQQMNNIRAYIKDAKSADRWEEVATLETNLRELQSLYEQQRRSVHTEQQFKQPDASSHPILQQIRQVQQLMRDAAREGRNDDLALFRQNVLELQAAYREEQASRGRSQLQSPLQS